MSEDADRKPHDPSAQARRQCCNVDGPVIETERLILRQWRASDIAANTAMLSDPGTARFITPTASPSPRDRPAGATPPSWRGIGRCMASACSWSRKNRAGTFVGRVGPWCPPGWPGFEVGWGIAREFRGKGYAVEAARASIDWAFATFEIDRDHPLHRSREYAVASRRAAAGRETEARDRTVRPCRRYLGDDRATAGRLIAKIEPVGDLH